LKRVTIWVSNVAYMGMSISPEIAGLKKKISLAEITILLLLVVVWLGMFLIVGARKERYIEAMVSLQGQVLSLADRQAVLQDLDPGTWPFPRVFRFFLVKDSRVVSSNLPWIESPEPSVEDAFGRFINSHEVLPRMRTGTSGTAWIRLNKVSPRIWISWSASDRGEWVFGVASDEEELLALTGFPDFRLTMLVCAALASALLLLSLIWVLSWLRLSAVKGFYRDR
jgi:hypothetical protein